MAERLILLAVALSALSGLPGLFFDKKSRAGQHLATGVLCAASLIGLAGAGLGIFAPGEGLADIGGGILGGRLKVQADPLSSFFLIPVFLIPALCGVYGSAYWPQEKHPENGQRLRFFYGLVPAGMALLLVAQNALLFLTAWEVMTLAAFFLVATEDEKPEVREAGWHYLVATHVGILALMAMFSILRTATGSYDLGPLAPGILTKTQTTAVFLLGLLGFGLKAGLMPLHVWLPGAHANAPSHVSAILSGVLLKMGIYGLVRLVGWLPAPPAWWGGLLLALGVISGVLGVLFALGQHDLKRLLAYHSIENIGIIVMGLGLALMGRSLGRPEWVALGLAGGILHVLNHGLFKSLLFLSAGSVIHAVHTREMDHMGGLAKRMPLTALAFLAGAVAICGLPPLNGFISEFLIYLGLFSAAARGEGAGFAGPAFAAPALALIGALAVVCFVKVYGTVFLGEPRSASLKETSDPPPAMVAPMAVLAGICALIGIAPFLLPRVLDPVVASWVPGAKPVVSIAKLAPLGWVSLAGAALLALLLALALWLRAKLRKGPVESTVTWDCGYLAPTARMQYTASSFAQMVVDLFSWALWPKKRGPRIKGYFPGPSRFHSETPDPVLDRMLTPWWDFSERIAGKFRVFQQGVMQVYVLYILATVLALLFWW
ncbi:hydrogenase [bacterium]|nr:MAG: hydrogenase [bacterium]